MLSGEIIKALLQRKRCLEYSLQAQHYADTIQDFNKEYEEVKMKMDHLGQKNDHLGQQDALAGGLQV